MNDWIVKIVDVGYKLEKDIYIFTRTQNGGREMLSGEIITDGVIPPKPTLSLTHQQMIALVNALNKEGVSPEKEYTAGKLEATEKHLEDMRKIALTDKE